MVGVGVGTAVAEATRVGFGAGVGVRGMGVGVWTIIDVGGRVNVGVGTSVGAAVGAVDVGVGSNCGPDVAGVWPAGPVISEPTSALWPTVSANRLRELTSAVTVEVSKLAVVGRTSHD